MPTAHSFHIPVMGLAFTIDSPIKVARFGISSAISIIEDRLIETMRRHYYGSINEKYIPISTEEPDYRAKRITDYLNLVNRIVHNQLEKLRASDFEAGSEVVQYFEMLPEESKLKQCYKTMLGAASREEKELMQDYLRRHVTAGSIDVNIMTKVDKNNYRQDGRVEEDGSDALVALRAYAASNLQNSSVIFSAGMNPRLFNYIEKINAFEATGWGNFAKKVVIKVSDFRSALIQGKYLAKKGVWVSEFRVESGLNCGGHAFATDGYLLGPIMEEFRSRKNELVTSLHELYTAALKAKDKVVFEQPHPIKLTVQGGIGTAEEAAFFRSQYGVSSTGWGTPFLLCPEATTVDEPTVTLLSKAGERDIELSHNSPLGVRFHYLKGTTSEAEKLERIAAGKPGSPCTEKYLVSDTEFTTEPICTASTKYQKFKLAQLETMQLTQEELQNRRDEVLAKECLCIGLSNSAVHVHGVPFLKKLTNVTICPGPNIQYFSKVVTLRQMTDHIYGRINLIAGVLRPHVFINELKLYISFLKEQYNKIPFDDKQAKYCQKFSENLLEGIAYYNSIAIQIADREDFLDCLSKAEEQVKELGDIVHA